MDQPNGFLSKGRQQSCWHRGASSGIIRTGNLRGLRREGGSKRRAADFIDTGWGRATIITQIPEEQDIDSFGSGATIDRRFSRPDRRLFWPLGRFTPSMGAETNGLFRGRAAAGSSATVRRFLLCWDDGHFRTALGPAGALGQIFEGRKREAGAVQRGEVT